MPRTRNSGLMVLSPYKRSETSSRRFKASSQVSTSLFLSFFFSIQNQTFISLSVKFPRNPRKIMELNIPTQTQTKHQQKIKKSKSMKRSSSSNSQSHTHVDSPHSPLYQSPLRSDVGADPPDSPPYASPDASPQKSPKNPDQNPNSKALVAVTDAFTQCSPPEKTLEESPAVTLHKAVREDGAPSVTKVGPGEGGRSRSVSAMRGLRTGEKLKVANIGFRLMEVVFCLISFSVMAADKTQGWSGDSFDRYKEYRYCLSINVIAFVYSGFQAAYYLIIGKRMMQMHVRLLFNFFMDQILAYLLISASSSAATRVDDWQSNWGKDEFTEMASASVAMSFLAFIAFAFSSILSGYYLCNINAT